MAGDHQPVPWEHVWDEDDTQGRAYQKKPEPYAPRVGMTNREVAEALGDGTSEKAVAGTVNRAIKKLRKQLGVTALRGTTRRR